MLEIGTQAPDFTLPDQNGDMHSLKDYRGKKVILYFYPRDNTAGCTKQACAFGELYPQFQEKDAVVLGVSKDSVASHKKFEEKYNLPFTLLSDPDKKVLQDYDVWKEKKNYGKVSMGTVRSTYLIDEDGKITELAPDGYFTREDFSGRIGRIVNIDYPNRDGSLLYRASRAVSSEESYDPMAILTELLSGSTDLGGMCGGFTADDISGVYKTDNTIVIDWKAGFTDKLRAYINSEDDTGIPQENRERAFIYSIVNTLTEIEDIGRVWMLEDGKKLGSIDRIYLGNSLMRNPGILVNE